MGNNTQHSQRLSGQTLRVYRALQGGAWLTLLEINTITGDPIPSVSCQIRHLRKVEYGSHTILKRRRGRAESGLFEYKLFQNEQNPEAA